MKQKIIIKLLMKSRKCHSKALEIAVGIPGVESVKLAGKKKDLVVVTGDGIDSVELTRLLRKKVAHAELVSVGKAKKGESDSDSESGGESDSDSDGHPPPGAFQPPPPPPPPYYSYCVVKESAGDSMCRIM